MFWTLTRIALRNLVAHRVKTAIVGVLLVFGAVLIVVGGSLVTTMDRSMEKSIVSSLSGHLQVYAADAKDKVSLFPSPIEGNDIGHIPDFPKLRRALEALPEVEAVVPQGIELAMVFGGNLLDRELREWRAARERGDNEAAAVTSRHVRKLITKLRRDLRNLSVLTDGDADARRDLAAVDFAATPAFWGDAGAADAEPPPGVTRPTTAIERIRFLENRVAHMMSGDAMIFLRYMGTDTRRFAEQFDRFEVVKGEAIPDGQRGFLFNDFFYERFIKHRVARRFDRMREKRALGLTFAESDELRGMATRQVRQYREITWQLDERQTATLIDKLRAVPGVLEAAREDPDGGGPEPSAEALARAFLAVDDRTFEARYAAFYEHVAPMLQMYRVGVGDTMTIRAQTRGGYLTASNVKVYGTFRFKSLEKSALSGAVNLMDLMTFRDLYGFVTADDRAEIERLQAGSGVQALARDEAEDALFGGGEDDAAEADGTTKTDDAADADPDAVPSAHTTTLVADSGEGFDEFAGHDMKAGAERWDEALLTRVYSEAELDDGVVPSAAIMLREGVAMEAGTAAVKRAIEAEELGVQVVDWQTASGLVGQFFYLVYAVLFGAIGTIFIVALVIMNNAMVMATMERTTEIGTMRAIGAQQRLVLWMFVVEALVTGVVFGTLGAALGAGIVWWLNIVGIPAFEDALVMLFAGPRLHPTLGLSHLVVALVSVVIVAIVSTLYPARLATRVSPVVAMQGND